MSTRPHKKMAAYFLIAIFLFSIDRYLKYFAITNQDTSIPLLGNLLKFNFAPNYGIAFSIPLGGMLLNYLLTIVILILTIVIVILFRKKEINQSGCLTILLIGAISNYIDRLKYGYVVDYIDLEYFTVFNIADCMIVGAVFGIFLLNYIKR